MDEDYDVGGMDNGYDDDGGMDDGALDIRGDFVDGSAANGTGRGDPGYSRDDYERLQQEHTRLSERARILDDFERNPEGVIRDVASRMGLDLVPQGGQRPGPRDNSNDPPREFIDRISQNLPPEMEFMAESLAKATWIATQETVKPYREQQEQQQSRSRQAEINAITAEMDSNHPNWRGSLSEMEELYAFMRDAVNGVSMKHQKFGSLQEMLYKLVSGDGRASANAANRMRNAARNASSISSGGSESGVDINKQISGTRDRQKKFQIAFRDALAQHNATLR